MTIDRTPKPCPHPRARHQHGHHLTYMKDGCRCTPCGTAYRRHRKASEYRTLTGTHSYVDAGRARRHVEQLLETLTVGQIEQRSGVHRTSIRLLVGRFPGKPASKRITRASEAALLAVTAERVGGEQQGLVDGTGTRRRFRALIALGHPAKPLGQRLGISTRTVWSLTNPAAPLDALVLVSTRDAVRRLYDELSWVVPPPSRARTIAQNMATARGWAPPLAWDDDAIDDPASGPLIDEDQSAEVDEHAIELVLDGQRMALTGADLEAAALALSDRGHTYADIAGRVHSEPTTIRRLLNTARKRLERAAAREAA